MQVSTIHLLLCYIVTETDVENATNQVQQGNKQLSRV